MKTMKTFLTAGFILLSLIPWNLARADLGGISHKEKIKAMIQLYVANKLSSGPEEIHIRKIVPTNGGSFQWSGKIKGIRPGSRERLLGRVLFVLSIEEDGREPGSIWITADVEKSQEIIVASRHLKRHHIIHPSDLDIRSIFVTRQRNHYLSQPEKLIGKRLTRSTRKGVPIRADLIEETPMILRGDRVMLLLESRGLRIMTLGKAKEDGFPGKIIGIQNLDSKKVVYGKVVEPGVVKVSFKTLR
ncbi:MAG: flagellar basal body P-ring formation chaperone FlgA [Nitrospiria bacterium]